MELAPIPALSMEALFPRTFRLPSSRHAPSTKSRYTSTSTSSPSHSPPFLPRSRPGSSKDSLSSASSSGSSASSSSHHSPSSSSRKLRSELAATYDIYIDTAPTPQSTPHTSYKTSHRASYNTARSRALPDPTDFSQEVLLFNTHGQMTEGSVLTPYFYRGGRWVTPAVEGEEHGGQRGTSRRWAVERGLCVVGTVERGSVRVGEKVWLSNGVRGFGWGRVRERVLQ